MNHSDMILASPRSHILILLSWILFAALVPGPESGSTIHAQDSGKSFEEIRRFSAPEAVQGVAVDDLYFYAIANRSIGKYDKKTGQRVKKWEDAAGGPFIHLDSGVVLDGLLYCAHSNFPATPMASSIEIFDTENLTPVGSHSFGIFGGSATWIDRWDGYWWVAFAHYAGNGGEPGKGPAWTALMKFDPEWRCVGGYTYPAPIIGKFCGMSNSGGSWGDDGLLYITGHDNAEIYALSLPGAGSVLVPKKILPVSAEGQGIAWDRSDPGAMYTSSKAMVVVSKLH
ncbi:MAG: hypothetical protein ACYC9O_16355 [Candidatus Latescibacterota bacterium]